MRSSTIRFAFVAIAFALFQGAAAAVQGAQPNIVFILADDQGWNGTSVQMDPAIPESKSDFYQTPNLEALAAAGMRFSAAYAAPSCSPTRAAIQTGKSPAQLHMTDVAAASSPASTWASNNTGQPLATPLVHNEIVGTGVLLPQWLDQNNSGYHTGHFGKWHVGNIRNSGYDQYIIGAAPPGENPKGMFHLANRAATYMQERVTANQPFFMQVSFAGTHAPFEATAASLAKYTALAENLPPDARHKNALYAAMTEDLDTATGRILQQIEDLGIADNTYVIYSTDNGAIAALGATESTPLFHSKGSVYEGGVRVPMIVKGPGVQAGAVSDVPVMLQDMFATVSGIASITAPLPSDLESANLLPIFQNGGELPSAAPLYRGAYAPNGEIFEHAPHFTGHTVFGKRVPASSVRDGDYKLVRIYGALGQPDTVLLFNIAENITETSDPNSPLNLASAMPQKTSELLGKLNHWLQQTDAALPYDLSKDFSLKWRADQPGTDPTAWRTTNNVDDYFRERFEPLAVGSRPTRASVTPYQQGIGAQTFRFDGDDGFSHEFFRVSDTRTPGVGDFNRSASIEMWFRTDAMDQDQILFESGDGSNGMSITMGDANGDGVKNDLRFRVLGSSGKSLTATVPVDGFADPTADFMLATAVFNDDPANRYVEIYLNGALATRIDGVPGASDSISWDLHNSTWTGFQHAGIGIAAGGGPGAALGANGGTGDLPFAGGLRGDIAQIFFHNYALTGAVVAANYNSNLDAVSFGVKSVTGATLLPAARPTDVSLGAAESNSLQVMQERQHQLAAPLAVDGLIVGGQTADVANPLTAGSIAEGTEFTGYLVHVDPIGSSAGDSTITGSVTFGYDIIGILTDADSLHLSDPILGSIGKYGATEDRGLELSGTDSIMISADRRTLSYHLTIANNDVAQFRILTEPAFPTDFNGDGSVDAADLALWASTTGFSGVGDADGDGISDGDDFLAWQRSVGRNAGSQVASETVPETTTAILMVFATAAVMSIRGRRGKLAD